jgi:hypothetical protein
MNPIENIDTIFTPSEGNISTVTGQRYMMNMGGQGTLGSRPQTKSSDRAFSNKNVGGKPSIKTLIKVATARDK